jgi:hypothetical protein
VDEEYVDKLHKELAARTSGLSVEQLEQVNTGLMDCIWKTRGEYNRITVVRSVQEAFNDILADMQALQSFGEPSHNTKMTEMLRSSRV